MKSKQTAIKFTGKGGPFFLLLLKCGFLTVITAGIYSFWAKVEIQKYIHSNTMVGDDTLEFHGTGKEKFIGFLKALIPIVLLVIIIFFIQRFAASIVGAAYVQVVSILLIYLLFFLMGPLLIVGKRRYLMSRTSWRGIRFRFKGKVKPLAILFLKNGLLTLITCGIYTPWFIFAYRKFKIENTFYGNEQSGFDGDAGEFAKIFYLGVLLSIVTCGIYQYWLQADIERYFWNHTMIQGKYFESTLTGDKLFVNMILAMVQIYFTLGIGTAWAINRMYRVFIENVSVPSEVDFSSIKSSMDTKASALADGIESAGDVLDSIADFFV